MRDVRALENAGLRLAIYAGYPATITGLVYSVGTQSWAWAGAWALAVAGVVAAALTVLPNVRPAKAPATLAAVPDPGQSAAASYLKKPTTSLLPPSPARAPYALDD